MSEQTEGAAVNRLAAQQALLLAIWGALPAEKPGMRFVDLAARLAEAGHVPHTRALRNALLYLESAGVLQAAVGDLWRRKEG